MATKEVPVKGMRTGSSYFKHEISDVARHAEMKSEPLYDDLGTAVYPVRHATSPYFRALGPRLEISDLPRSPRSPEHDAAVAELVSALNAAPGKVEFFTNFFPKAGNRRELPVFATPAGSNYRFYTECTMLSEDRIRIRPDIAGRNIEVFSPTIEHRAIIIEVIHSHPPDLRTFERLRSLSMAGHQVFFYSLLRMSPRHGLHFNKLELEPEPKPDRVRVRVSYWLENGELYKNGAVLSPQSKDPQAQLVERLKHLDALKSS